MLEVRPGSNRQPWQGMKLAVTGKITRDSDVAFYGRWSSGSALANTQLSGALTDAGGSYGVGVAWGFTPNTSATLGWDSHELRQGGSERELRSTNLGLQWRY